MVEIVNFIGVVGVHLLLLLLPTSILGDDNDVGLVGVMLGTVSILGSILFGIWWFNNYDFAINISWVGG